MTPTADLTRHPLIFDVETIGEINDDHRDEIAALAAGRELPPDAYAALCPPLARVVCIAWFDPTVDRLAAVCDATLCPGDVPATVVADYGSGRTLSCDVRGCDGEAALLRAFGQVTEQHLAQPNSRLVTYNGRGFDLPVLIHRSIAQDITDGRALLIKAMGENRYRPQVHIDLMEAVTFSGASNRWPMSTYAIGYGYPSPKANMHGAEVSAAVRTGRIIDVVRYCAGDVLATAHIYERGSCLLPP
jgi:hypothetical protein